MPIVKTPSGSEVIDHLIAGGFENDIITTIYGPSGSGKTNLCILFSCAVAKNGKKVIYVDTENNFSFERFKQITPDYAALANQIIFLKPVNFQEQKKAFETLKGLIDNHIGAVIVDTISMLYRLEIGQANNVYEVNRELGQQISFLSEITRKKHIPVLIANQVYQSFEEKDKVHLVGGDILKYGSKCLLELQKYKESYRKLIIRKHRALPEGKEILFRITQNGFSQIEEKKKKTDEI